MLLLWLAGSPFEASSKQVAPLHARLAACRMGNLHGEFLSAHKISQTWPGAPDACGRKRIGVMLKDGMQLQGKGELAAIAFYLHQGASIQPEKVFDDVGTRERVSRLTVEGYKYVSDSDA